jgi:hypothetical protein
VCSSDLYTYDDAHIELANGFTLWSAAHEVGHSWDAGWSGLLSLVLQKCTGSYDPLGLLGLFVDHPNGHEYDPGLSPSAAGVDQKLNGNEDFAESFTAYVFPIEAKRRAEEKRVYYSDYQSTLRGRVMGALLVSVP